jgi:hypothetical protein
MHRATGWASAIAALALAWTASYLPRFSAREETASRITATGPFMDLGKEGPFEWALPLQAWERGPLDVELWWRVDRAPGLLQMASGWQGKRARVRFRALVRTVRGAEVDRTVRNDSFDCVEWGSPDCHWRVRANGTEVPLGAVTLYEHETARIIVDVIEGSEALPHPRLVAIGAHDSGAMHHALLLDLAQRAVMFASVITLAWAAFVLLRSCRSRARCA